MGTLNLFPARVPIGTVDDSGQVLMTPEFFRALTDLLQRVGGTTAPDNSDLDVMSSLAQSPVVDFGSFMDAAMSQQSAADAYAVIAEANKAIQDLQAQIIQSAAQLAELRKQADSLEVTAGYSDPFRVNWERPGSIGSLTAASGAFTTLTASGAVTLSPANANVVASPTGTGTVTIAPATAGTMNNITIGAVTPQNGTFKQLLTDGTANALLGTDATNSDVISRGSNSGAGGGASFYVRNNGVSIIGIGNKSRFTGAAYDAKPYIFANATIEVSQDLQVPGGAFFLRTLAALTNGAGAGAGTITNAPAAGNPTKWIAINDAGTTRYIPAW